MKIIAKVVECSPLPQLDQMRLKKNPTLNRSGGSGLNQSHSFFARLLYHCPQLGLDIIYIVVPKAVMVDANDDFKWFGEGFDGFPKRLPDDSIEYNIYVLDQNLQDTKIRQKLRSVQSSASTLTKNLLKDFIWQRESFVLELVRENGKVLGNSYQLVNLLLIHR